MLAQAGGAAVGRDQHRDAAGHRLQIDQAQGVDLAGEHEGARRGVQAPERGAGAAAGEADEGEIVEARA